MLRRFLTFRYAQTAENYPFQENAVDLRNGKLFSRESTMPQNASSALSETSVFTYVAPDARIRHSELFPLEGRVGEMAKRGTIVIESIFILFYFFFY